MKKKFLCLMAIGALMAQDQAEAMRRGLARQIREENPAGRRVGRFIVPREVVQQPRIQPPVVVPEQVNQEVEQMLDAANFNPRLALQAANLRAFQNFQQRVADRLVALGGDVADAQQAQHAAEQARDGLQGQVAGIPALQQQLADAQQAQHAAEQARDGLQAQVDGIPALQQQLADAQQAQHAAEQARDGLQAQVDGIPALQQQLADAQRERDEARAARAAAPAGEAVTNIAQYLANYDPLLVSFKNGRVDAALAAETENLQTQAMALYTAVKFGTPLNTELFIQALEAYMARVGDDKHVAADPGESLRHLYGDREHGGFVGPADDLDQSVEDLFTSAILEYRNAAMDALGAAHHAWAAEGFARDHADEYSLINVAIKAAYYAINGQVEEDQFIDKVRSEVIRAAYQKNPGNIEALRDIYDHVNTAAPIILDAMNHYREGEDAQLDPLDTLFADFIYNAYYVATKAQIEQEAIDERGVDDAEHPGWTDERVGLILKYLQAANILPLGEPEEAEDAEGEAEDAEEEADAPHEAPHAEEGGEEM